MKRLVKDNRHLLATAAPPQPALTKKNEELMKRIGKSRQEIMDLMKILKSF